MAMVDALSVYMITDDSRASQSDDDVSRMRALGATVIHARARARAVGATAAVRGARELRARTRGGGGGRGHEWIRRDDEATRKSAHAAMQTWGDVVADMDDGDARAGYAIDVGGSTEARCARAVVVVPGLTDGPESLAYVAPTSALAEACRARGVKLVRFELTSSYERYGTVGDLDSDAEEIAMIVRAVAEKFGVEKFTLLGHSTGCQSICHLMRTTKDAGLIDKIERIVLQAGVSDRDWYDHDNGVEVMREAVQLAESMASPTDLMPTTTAGTYGVPTTARRFMSLAGRNGDDDWFSLDIFDGSSSSDAAPMNNKIATLTTCANVDVRLVVSTQDEYVPYDDNTVRAHNERIRAAFDAVAKSATTHYVAANHDLSDMKDDDVAGVVDFILL
jgi:pimeloyl-ACP methyl ester carboxylesterase